MATLQLERLYQRRLAHHPKDTLLYYPVSKLDPDLGVNKARKASRGMNDNIALDNILMLLFQPSGDPMLFDLYYTEFDPHDDASVEGNLEKFRHPVALLRFGDPGQQVVWPIGKISQLKWNNPPAQWKQKAVFAVFRTGDNSCETQSLAHDPDSPEAGTPVCVMYCQYPQGDMVAICRAWSCLVD